MKIFEISLNIINEKYVDSLMVSLIHQGYNVYYNPMDRVVHFTISENEVFEIPGKEKPYNYNHEIEESDDGNIN